MNRYGGVVLGVVLASLTLVVPGEAQDALESRLGSDGWTGFEVATREGVQLCGMGTWRSSRRGFDPDRDCSEGSVLALVRTTGGRVIEIEHRPPRSTRGPDVDVDLGWVSTGDAAAFLLDLVPGEDDEVAEDALGLAAMLDSVTIWPDLDRFASDRGLSGEVRQAALFWLGQAAADEATASITAVLDTPDEEVEIKEAAVFALSQRPDEVAVRLLLDVAQGDYHPEVRESAFFWLSQFDDPRVLEFFREVLAGL
ncbi:MAG: HEAT repeat domain-containing protein [Longimicrobiales bacterium]